MNPTSEQLGREIVAICQTQLGFALAGVAPARPSAFGPQLRAWLDAGKHGSMAYLADHVEARLDPGRVLPGARSMVLVADQYAIRGEEVSDDASGATGRAAGRIARYARGRDYHRVVRERLHALADLLRARFPDAAFRAFNDTAPVLEREHAASAGLGWIGKHTLLIHPRIGSYTLLGGLLTTLDVASPREQEIVADHCGSCTRCIDACPTGAITPYEVDASRCIAYLTIERREAIPPAFHEAIGPWLFGCDVCQEVCPHNSPRGRGVDVGLVNPAYAARHTGFDPLGLLDWREEDRRENLYGTPLARMTLAMLKRNAIIVLGNVIRVTRDPMAIARLRQVPEDESEPELVRQTAREVLGRVGG